VDRGPSAAIFWIKVGGETGKKKENGRNPEERTTWTSRGVGVSIGSILKKPSKKRVQKAETVLGWSARRLNAGKICKVAPEIVEEVQNRKSQSKYKEVGVKMVAWKKVTTRSRAHQKRGAHKGTPKE